MKIRVRLGTQAQDALRRAPPGPKKHLRQALEALGSAPRGLDTRELRQVGPGPAVYRMKVGSWRIAFRWVGKDIEVVRIFHRRDGYGWMERLP
ncbi:MAG: type II toxin-antitoxin system RelE/ParE family toxin [Candidatus Thermoplasmatota archaeon]